MMGSLVFQGDLPLAQALATVGIDGTSVGENLARIGYAGTAATGNNRVHAFVELHVEQGPVLEHEEYTIGAVTGVQGIHWIESSCAACPIMPGPRRWPCATMPASWPPASPASPAT